MASLPFLDEILTFPDRSSYQRLESITDFRQCHGVTPPERRILFRCKRITPEASSSKSASNGEKLNDDNDIQDHEEFILKIKVQIPDDPTTITTPPTATPTLSQPSAPTAHELKALTTFRDSQTTSAPQLVAFSHIPQDLAGPLPQEGYISSTVMSKLGGKSLFELGYWSLGTEEREEIQRGFLDALG